MVGAKLLRLRNLEREGSLQCLHPCLRPSQEVWNIIDKGTIADPVLLDYLIIHSFALSFLQRGFLCLAPLTASSEKVIYKLPGTKQ